jgi:hypothetical protein
MLTLEDIERNTNDLKALIKQQLKIEIHAIKVEQIHTPPMFRISLWYKNRTLVPGQVYWSSMTGYIYQDGRASTYSFINCCIKIFEDWVQNVASKIRQIKRTSTYKHELNVKTFRPVYI